MTEAEAWLRVVLYEMRDADFDHYQTSLTYMRTRIEYFSRVLEKQPGFQGAQWGVDLDDGKVSAVSRWSSLHSILGANGELGRLQSDAQAHGIRRVHVQNIRLFPISANADTGPDGSPHRDPMSAENWLRLVTYRVALPEDERATHYMMVSIQDCLKVLEKQPGFQRGYWGRDSSGGGMAAVTYWSTLDAIAAAGPTLRELQMEAASNGVCAVDERNIHLFAGTPVSTDT
jgi:heme-degrading monooxygenase HmoA